MQFNALKRRFVTPRYAARWSAFNSVQDDQQHTQPSYRSPSSLDLVTSLISPQHPAVPYTAIAFNVPLVRLGEKAS